MSDLVKTTRANVISTMRYDDPAAAVDFLCDAFGFARALVVPGKAGGVEHAQLTFGNGMVMLGPVRDDEFDRYVKPPSATGGVGTQSVYLVVTDCDAHHDRAKAAGAEVLMPPEDQDYGGRNYTCRDPQGHVWSFGTYDPWEGA
jgi:uncharacterized glyoxalase superfamily protein PhnB